jgi:hypothetical protein
MTGIAKIDSPAGCGANFGDGHPSVELWVNPSNGLFARIREAMRARNAQLHPLAARLWTRGYPDGIAQRSAIASFEYGSIAINCVAESIAAETASDAVESLESRLGQAFHRLLERYVPVVQSGQPVQLAHDTQQARIAREFDLDAAAMARALAIAMAIVQGEGSWAWDSSQLDWQGNEVEIAYRGRLLRIDRLVLRRGADGKEGQWWVLDYKSASHPHQLPELRDQLWSYRMAVALAHPGETVRAAFLTARGTLIELLTP